MQTFSNIFNGESGSSVRGKLNNVLTSIISGSEGINAIWEKIESVTQRINGMDSGISHIVKDTSYNPSSLDPYKNAVLIALCTGTFNNIKDKNGTPITIPGSNALTIFYRAANTTYWEYDTQEIFPAVDSYESNDYSKISSAKTHVMTHSGNAIKPMTDFNSVYDLDGNNLTKTFERLHTIVLASMGTAVDNEGNDSDVAIGYVPSVGDRYYDSATGHIKWVKSSTVTEDLGLPSEDRIYCNGMTQRLYVFKNGWKKVGEPNEDLTSLKSNVASNSENIQSIVSALSTKVDKSDIKQSTGTSTTAVMSQKAVSGAINKLASKTIYADESVNFDEVGYYAAEHFFYRIEEAQNTGFVFIEGYEKVSCEVSLSKGGYAIAFFDDNKTFISGLLGDERQRIYNANVPNGAKYVVFSHYGSGPKNATIYPGETLIKRIGAIENDMVTKSSAITFVSSVGNLFDKSKVIVGKEVYGDGSLQIESQSAASDYINVMGQKTIFFNNLPIYDGFNRYLAFYNSEKTLISTDRILSSKSKSTVNVPTNAVYFRFSLYQRWKSGSKDYESVMVTFGEYKEYEPYIEYLSSIGGFNIQKIDTLALTLKTAGKKALIFGDSITETATISDDGNTYTEGVRVNWPTFALPMLGIKDFRNYGMSGATYKDTGSTQYRQNVSEQITMAMANSYNDDANIVIMSLGTNDGSENIGSFDTAMGKTTLESLDRTNLYEALRWAMWTLRTKYQDAIFYVGLPIQRAYGEQPETMLNAIREMAHRYNFIVIEATNESGIIRDLETSGSEGRYLYDGLHPNSAGSQLLGALYANKILTNYLVGR